jgi:hypothetical protein
MTQSFVESNESARQSGTSSYLIRRFTSFWTGVRKTRRGGSTPLQVGIGVPREGVSHKVTGIKIQARSTAGIGASDE